MSKNDPIMKRMKENYEIRSRTYLTRRTPVIIRLDGKAFHTYTKDLDKPFDEGLIEDMVKTAEFLCSQIQGAKCAYVQSDEISILLTDYDKLHTDAWFDYQVQKMCSVAASMATAKFNQLRLVRRERQFVENTKSCFTKTNILITPMAFFDARAFNMPIKDVPNYFHARQRDAVKNSISMLAQSLYSHKELHKKNSSEMQEMCFEKGHNWNGLHYSKKRGSFIVKNTYVDDMLAWKQINGPQSLNLLLEGQMHEQKGKVYTATKLDEDLYIHEIKQFGKGTIKKRWETIETPIKLNDLQIYKEWIE